MIDDPNDDSRDIDVTARTIYGEARGEGIAGMQAVACVIVNRAKIAKFFYFSKGHAHPLFGDGSEASACSVPWQFSCWNENDPNCQVINSVDASNSIFSMCISIARNAIAGNLTDNTGGATHYYDRRSPMPQWARGLLPCANIGHHIFFNDVP